jgi:hypothetical protein
MKNFKLQTSKFSMKFNRSFHEQFDTIGQLILDTKIYELC